MRAPGGWPASIACRAERMRVRGVPRRKSAAIPTVLGIVVGLLAPLGLCAPPAGAVVVTAPAGRISYLPLNEGAAARLAGPTQRGAGPQTAAPTGQPPL